MSSCCDRAFVSCEVACATKQRFSDHGTKPLSTVFDDSLKVNGRSHHGELAARPLPDGAQFYFYVYEAYVPLCGEAATALGRSLQGGNTYGE
jgi:hypothetical protein